MKKFYKAKFIQFSTVFIKDNIIKDLYKGFL